MLCSVQVITALCNSLLSFPVAVFSMENRVACVMSPINSTLTQQVFSVAYSFICPGNGVQMSGSLQGGFCSASLAVPGPCRVRGSSLALVNLVRLYKPLQLPGHAGIHCSSDVSVNLDSWALNKAADSFCG